MNTTRIRIREHRKVLARDLVAHPLNPRVHPDFQKAALRDILGEIGFARSLLAFELPDGRLQLIDGHLRAQLLSHQEVIVEILDVSPAEANALLLSLDPLTGLARHNADTLDQLRQAASTSSESLQQLWDSMAASQQATEEALASARENPDTLPRQFLVLVTCDSEAQQTELLREFQTRDLQCKALLS